MFKMLLFAFLISLIYYVTGVPQEWIPEQPSCGISKYPDAGEYELPKPFIVGGIEARRNEFPWQARVNYKGLFTCGGSIINDRWILTAAHCTVDFRLPYPPKHLALILGDHLRDEKGNPYRQVISAEKIFNHPKYTFPHYDISLIKTSRPIIFNENVSRICLPEPNNTHIHQKAVMSGWGATKSGEYVSSNVLLYTTLNTTTKEYCQNNSMFTITDAIICATDNKNDNERSACPGDSGGPLAVKDSNGIFSIIGVVTYAIGCAKGYPTGFARVNHVLDWINETIEK